jgi:hypothetical protein
MAGGEVEGLVEFGVSEYTLVFRRMRARTPGERLPRHGWTVVKPAYVARRSTLKLHNASDGEVAEVFVVPFCSTLALDILSYERFLSQSGVLDRALARLARARLSGPRSVETMRKRIQSLVMAAEVEQIVAEMMKGA